MASLPSVLLIMGVAGAGKSTYGEALAAEFGWPFRDADSFHPEANIIKMKSGTPLTDDDRWPWLDAIAGWIDAHRTAGTHGIVTCSALKRIYRQRLTAGRDDVRLVYLKGDKALIAKRMAARTDHFMPTALLDSQFATLEEPDAGEWPVVVAVDGSPRRVKERILAELAG
ncbi:MAG: gluconokinase [Hyphomicrobiaceae bacterium]